MFIPVILIGCPTCQSRCGFAYLSLHKLFAQTRHSISAFPLHRLTVCGLNEAAENAKQTASCGWHSKNTTLSLHQ